MADPAESAAVADSAEIAKTTGLEASAKIVELAEPEASNAETRRNLSAFKSDGTPDYSARIQAYEKIRENYHLWLDSQPPKAPKEESTAPDVPTYSGWTRAYPGGGPPGCQPDQSSGMNASLWEDMQTEKGKAEQAAFEAKNGTYEDWYKGILQRLENIREIREMVENDPKYAEQKAWEKTLRPPPTWLSVTAEQLDPNLHPKDRMYKPSMAQKYQMGGYEYWLWKKEQDEAAAVAEAGVKGKTKAPKGKGKK